jgi:transposase
MLKAETQYLPLTDQDREIFDALVPPDHYLRLVQAAVDFQRFREILLASYSATLGRPPIEPVLLLKAEFLQFHYGLSDREVIRQCQVNMAFRFFLDLGLRSPLPDPSLLSHFRARLGPEAHRQIFQDLIAQARQHGLVKDRLRLKDATHVLANIAVPSTLTLVAQVRDQLLAAIDPYVPHRARQERAEVQRLQVATADLADAQRLVHAVDHLRTIVAWVEGWLAAAGPAPPAGDPARSRLDRSLALAHKVLHDRDDPQAQGKVVSAQDVDARKGWHHQWYTGYLLDVAMDADSEMITALDVLPAGADEAANATKLIRQEEQAQGNDIEALSIDGIGFRGDLIEQWSDPEGLDLEVIVPPSEPAPPAGFPPESFALDAAGQELTCPAGQTTRSRARNEKDTGWRYRFRPAQCAGCPLRAQCLAQPETTTGGRTVIKNDHEATYRAAREKAKTPRYREVRRQHPRIERKLGELVRWHGARRARYRGRAQVLIQGLLTGLIVNIKRLVKLRGSVAAAAAGTVRAGLAGV